MKVSAAQEALYRRILDLRPTKGDRKRIVLLEALIESLAEDGWENVSFETLGRRVNMQKGHVAYYFPTRDDMVQLAVKYVFAVGQDMAIDRLTEASDWEGRVRGWVEAPFDWLIRYPRHSAVVRLLFYLSSYDDHYRRLNTEIRRMGIERASLLIDERYPALNDRKKRSLAHEMQALITGVILGHVSTDSEFPLVEARDRTVEATFRTLETVGGSVRRTGPRRVGGRRTR